MGDLTDYERYTEGGGRRVPKKRVSPKKAVFIDMRPDLDDKSAIKHLLEKWDDSLGTLGALFTDPRMKVTFSFDVPNDCWQIVVSDSERKWPNITYYTFRHKSIPTLFAFVGFTVSQKWGHSLPLDVKEVELYNWD